MMRREAGLKSRHAKAFWPVQKSALSTDIQGEDIRYSYMILRRGSVFPKRSCSVNEIEDDGGPIGHHVRLAVTPLAINLVNLP
jgi:hypothetical protein